MLKDRLNLIAVISLALNVVLVFLLFREPASVVDTHAAGAVARVPLNYETFKAEWGRAWLGVDVSPVTPEMAARAQLDRVEGAFVEQVALDSPAMNADIVPGDIIISFNGRKIRTPLQFQNDVAGSRVGSEVYMCVARADYRFTAYVIPTVRPSDLPPLTKMYPYLGATVSDAAFDSDQMEKLEEEGKSGGVLVEQVISGSPAQKGGLEAGDLIMSFNSRKTTSLREFLADLSGTRAGETVRMCIMRGEYRKTLYVTLGRAEGTVL